MDRTPISRLKACLNGGRMPAEHPAVPLTPSELAVAGRDAVRAGAEAVHLHPRGPGGRESLLGRDVGAAVAAVRAGCPGVPVGISTGLWITSGDVGRRQSQVADWIGLDATERPDFASVNLSEPGSAELVAALAQAGIGAEAGVWSVADARSLKASLDRGTTWERVLVEITGGVPTDQAVGVVDQVLAAVRSIPLSRPEGDSLPVLLHGEGDATWALVEYAGRLGLATRIGLEDVLTGPDGEPVRDTAHLVTLALSLWKTE